MSTAPDEARPIDAGEKPEGAAEERVVPQRGPGPAPGSRRGPGAFMAGQSTEKALDFKASSRRLLGMLRPERPLMRGTLRWGPGRPSRELVPRRRGVLRRPGRSWGRATARPLFSARTGFSTSRSCRRSHRARRTVLP